MLKTNSINREIKLKLNEIYVNYSLRENDFKALAM